jgi:prophage regulatory protein
LTFDFFVVKSSLLYGGYMATRPTTTTRGHAVNPQPLHAAELENALLTLKTASAVAGISEATIYRKASTDPTFPKLIKMGARCTRIRAGDLSAWIRVQAGA